MIFIQSIVQITVVWAMLHTVVLCPTESVVLEGRGWRQRLRQCGGVEVTMEDRALEEGPGGAGALPHRARARRAGVQPTQGRGQRRRQREVVG